MLARLGQLHLDAAHVRVIVRIAYGLVTTATAFCARASDCCMSNEEVLRQGVDPTSWHVCGCCACGGSTPEDGACGCGTCLMTSVHEYDPLEPTRENWHQLGKYVVIGTGSEPLDALN